MEGNEISASILLPMRQPVLVLLDFLPFINESGSLLTGSGDFQVAVVCVLHSWATWKSPLPVRLSLSRRISAMSWTLRPAHFLRNHFSQLCANWSTFSFVTRVNGSTMFV